MSQKDCNSSEGGLQAIPAEELWILIRFPGASTKPTEEPIHQSQQFPERAGLPRGDECDCGRPRDPSRDAHRHGTLEHVELQRAKQTA